MHSGFCATGDIQHRNTAAVPQQQIGRHADLPRLGIPSAADVPRIQQRGELTPARLGLDEPVVLVPRQIMLVTYDDGGRRLLLAPSGGAP